jgi:O-antigen/teichoic acid export membrane protein
VGTEGSISIKMGARVQLPFKKLDRDFRDLISGTALAFVLRAFGTALAFAFNVAIGRVLGAEGAGLYFTALAIVLNVSILCRLGLDNAVIRLVAAALSQHDWGRVNGVVRLSMISALSASVIGGAGIALFAYLFADRVFDDPRLPPLLYVMALGVVTFSMMMLGGAALRALERLREGITVAGIVYPLTGLILIWPMTQIFGLVGAGIAYVGGTGVAALLGRLFWRKHAEPAPPSTDVGAELKASALPLLPMNIMSQGILPTAPLLFLGIWGTAQELGQFGAASRISVLVTFFLMSVNMVISPKLAALYKQGARARLIKTVRRGGFLVIALSSPVLLVLLFGAQHVMGLFGPEFVGGATALVILLLGQAVNAATGSVNLLLMMSGHERDARTTAFFGLCVMLVLCLALIPTYGIIGAAIAGASAVATINLSSLWYVWRRLNFIALPVPMP